MSEIGDLETSALGLCRRVSESRISDVLTVPGGMSAFARDPDFRKILRADVGACVSRKWKDVKSIVIS